jgi:hypothetical protein
MEDSRWYSIYSITLANELMEDSRWYSMASSNEQSLCGKTSVDSIPQPWNYETAGTSEQWKLLANEEKQDIAWTVQEDIS